MKKFLQRVFGIIVTIISLGYNFCYADEIDPMFPYNPSSSGLQEPATVNIVPMIIIGVAIAVIVVGAIIMLVKSEKEKDKEKNDKK